MPEEKINVQFTSDYEVKDEKAGTPEARRFKKGEKKSLDRDAAMHFVGRGLAEIVSR